MKILFAGLVALFAALATGLVTGRFRRYALDRGIIDVPNSRSSHDCPTPRGGGLAIVLTALVAFLALGGLQWVSWPIIFGLWGAGAIAAAIGFSDDRTSIGLLPRLAGHFAAAACVIQFVGTSSIADGIPFLQDNGAAAAIFGAFYLVWMLNLTNFMDGIDGLASVEAITVCTGGIICALFVKFHLGAPAVPTAIVSADALTAALYAPLLLAASTLGFLFWNWPPARIFMGDAGSGFLGICLGTLSLVAGRAAPQLFWSWFILVAVFASDATVTLLRRVVRREKFYQAHRSHAYQHAAARFGHQRVTIACAAINVLWLLPLALGVAVSRLPIAAVAVAYAPLLIVTLLLRAGVSE